MAEQKDAFVQDLTYPSYGAVDFTLGMLDNTRQFTNKEIDEKSGLSYFGARYYNPEIGRWISRDRLAGSLMNPQSLNRYRYAFNNPFKYIDPLGLYEIVAQIDSLNQTGSISFVNDKGETTFSARVLGRADSAKAIQEGNPTRDRTKSYGDSPYGDAEITGVINDGGASDTLGDRVKLKGISGEILSRDQAAGGDALLRIHAGDKALANDGTSLRPTYGCYRVDGSTIDRMIQLIKEANKAGDNTGTFRSIPTADDLNLQLPPPSQTGSQPPVFSVPARSL